MSETEDRRWAIAAYSAMVSIPVVVSFAIAYSAWRATPAPSIGDLEVRQVSIGMTQAELKAIFGPPTSIVTIDGNDVWYYGAHELAAIGFKDGKCTGSNMIYYVGDDGERLATGERP